MSLSPFEHYLIDEFWLAYNNARKGKRHTVDEHRFELNAMANIINLCHAATRRHYCPGRGVAFIVRDPVIREIVAAPFRDRVIHHFLYNICADWWDRRFIPDSYSCRKGKGTLYAEKRVLRHITQVTQHYTTSAFAVKLDIQGYFMSLQHEKLYQRILWGLEQQFYHSSKSDLENNIRCSPTDKTKLYNLLKYLWHQVIFDKPMQNIAIRGQRSDWKLLPHSKSLFNQPAGQGIVIGNLTSQLLSNIFLDQLDRFVNFELGYKHYGRYVDDFFIIVPLEKREQLLRDIPIIRHYLKSQLGLTLHPRKQHAQVVEKGIPFVGGVIYPGFIVPGKRSKRKCYQSAYKLAAGANSNLEGFVSRLGSLEHICHRKFLKQLFDSFGWDYPWQELSDYQASHRQPPQCSKPATKTTYSQTSLFRL